MKMSRRRRRLLLGGSGAPESGFPFEDQFDLAGPLVGHLADSGERWTFQAGSATSSPASIIDGGVWSPASTTRYYDAHWRPGSPDTRVDALFQHYTTISDNFALCGRMDPATATCYFATWSSAAGGWRLFKNVLGVTTQIGTTLIADTFTSGTRVCRLTMQGTTITVHIDNVLGITETDNAIASAGSCGLRCSLAQGAATGRHCMSMVGVIL